jgi:hypothetical protein
MSGHDCAGVSEGWPEVLLGAGGAVVAKWEGELRPQAEGQAEIDADEGLVGAARA